jgi:hypothetical protein
MRSRWASAEEFASVQTLPGLLKAGVRLMTRLFERGNLVFEPREAIADVLASLRGTPLLLLHRGHALCHQQHVLPGLFQSRLTRRQTRLHRFYRLPLAVVLELVLRERLGGLTQSTSRCMMLFEVFFRCPP